MLQVNDTLARITWFKRTHPHWLAYRDVIESVDQSFLNFLGVFLTLVSVVGILGNVTVVLVFIRTPLLRKHSNILIINLAICDLVFSAVIGFPLTVLSCFQRRWLWGDLGCVTYAFLAGWTGLCSITCLAFISMDRYMVIVHPLYMLDKKSSSLITFVKLAIVWSWAFVWSVPPLFGWGRYVPEAFGISCTFDYLTRSTNNISFNFCLFIFGFFLPVGVIVTSYAGILKEVVRSNRIKRRRCLVEFNRTADFHNKDLHNDHHHHHLTTKRRTSRCRQELKTAKVLACCVGAFLTCWTPYAVVAQLGINGAAHLINPYTSEVPVLFAKTSSLWNPFIYAFSHPKYKRAILMALSRIHWRFMPERQRSGTDWWTNQHRQGAKSETFVREGGILLSMDSLDRLQGRRSLSADERECHYKTGGVIN